MARLRATPPSSLGGLHVLTVSTTCPGSRRRCPPTEASATTSPMTHAFICPPLRHRAQAEVLSRGGHPRRGGRRRVGAARISAAGRLDAITKTATTR